MSKYCPTWIIDCIIAEASIDFIELEVGLEFISKKYKIVGVGASAKGNTFINFLGLTNKEIFAVTDISKFKIRKDYEIFYNNLLKFREIFFL